MILAGEKAGEGQWEDVVTKAVDSRGRDAVSKTKTIRKEGEVIVGVRLSAFGYFDVVVVVVL
jgi:hypothetical protein